MGTSIIYLFAVQRLTDTYISQEYLTLTFVKGLYSLILLEIISL